MPRVPDQFLNCVIYLYASEGDAESGVESGGSGFLVGMPVDFPNCLKLVPLIYVVTNRHVVESGYTTIRMVTKDGNHAVFPTDEREWISHPDGDDLSIHPLIFDPRHHIFSFIYRDNFIDKARVAEFNLGPGDDTFLVGRFINHEGKIRNTPTVRFGCIGQMPLEPVKKASGFEQESFLVEVKSISGYSGSPVFIFIPAAAVRPVENWIEKILMSHGPWLLGIDWGHINDWVPVCDGLGRPINPSNPLSQKVKMNTGMMAVVPAWKLAELLDHETVVDQRVTHIKDMVKLMMENTPSPATSD